MGMFEGKKGLVLGVANDHSIAAHCAKELMDQGAICAFSHLPDKPDDEKKKNTRRVEKALRGYEEKTKFLTPLDVQNDDHIAALVEKTKEEFGTIDFLIHSVAFADIEDLKRDTIETSRAGFKMAMDISVYSLMAVANAMKDVITEGGSICCMTYYGGEKVVSGYNVMGICKAALDCATKYLAFDLGLKGIRVNAISAGPVKTLAGSAAGVKEMLDLYAAIAPLGRNIDQGDVAKAASYLLSDMSCGVTGEILHVDAGYNIMGSPGRMLDQLKQS